MVSHRPFHAATLAAVLALAAPFAATAAVEQIADIYPEPGEVSDSIYYKVHQGKDGLWFFSAETPADGRELWVTDGTVGGTHRLTDTPGANDTDPEPGVFIGDEFYFVADSDDIGDALWKSDGTVAGTQLVFEAVPGPSDDDLEALTAIDGALYFDTIVNGQFSLWTSDGTPAGTRKIKAIGSGNSSSSGYHIGSVDGRILFSADDGMLGRELWITDGTAGGTVLLKDINGSGDSSPEYFASLDATHTLFAANGGLWITDGTAGGTHSITIEDGAETGSDPIALVAAGGSIYFLADSSADGKRVWQTDGSTTSLVDVSATGYDNAEVYGLRAGGPDIYFSTKNGGPIGKVLLKYDGASGSLVYDAGADGIIAFFTYGNGKLYFNTLGPPNQLFVYDGATLTPIKDFAPAYLTVSGSKLFMWARDGTHGEEPWVSDGTGAGTHMIANLAGPDAGSEPGQFTVANGRLVFGAYDPTHGYEPRISDGTAAGTRLLADIEPGPGDSEPDEFTVVGDTVYFTAGDDTHGYELWKVTQDGSAALVKDIEPGGDESDPDFLVAFHGELYFSAWTSASGAELWKSDGTEAGTVMVANLDSSDSSSFPHYLTVVGDKLFFIADDPGDGDRQLWVSDGTEAGTKEITSGTFDDIYKLISMDSVLYFIVRSGAASYDIWRSDGTAAGTTLVANVVTGANGGPPPDLTAYDGHLYFAAWTAASGMELWRTDGTAGGTKPFADILPDAPSSWPYGFTAAGGKLYFGAYGPDGRELWMTDGVKTVQVKDINPGLASSGPDYLTAIGNRIAFAASDGVNGYELWISDGTAAGTRMIDDVSPGAGNSNPYEFILFKRQLFFDADDGATGDELWRADINRRPVASDAAIATAFETAYSGKLTATDPDGDALTFGVTKKPAHGKVELTDASTGEFTYTPVGGYSGEDNFTFKADDGLAGSVAAVNITVEGNGAGDGGAGTPPGGGTATPPASGSDGGSGGGGGWGFIGGLLMLAALSRRRFAKHWESAVMQKIISSACAASVLWFAVAGFAAHAAVEEVKDIYPPPGINVGSIFPLGSALVSKNGAAFFSATTLSEGMELWFTDGTAAGTRRVTDAPGANSTLVNSEVYLGDDLYFTVDGKTGEVIWTSDGTAAGTGPVFELVPGPSNESLLGLSAVNGKLYFDVLNDNRFSVWTSDGTTAGTHIIKVINTNQNSLSGYSFGPAPNGEVLFNADDGTHGNELWITDGTEGGTHMLADIEPGGSGSHPGAFTVLPGQTVFFANDVLWSTDGSAAGTVEIPLTHGTDTVTLPKNLRVVDGVLFFRAVRNGGFRTLWRWDGVIGDSLDLVDLSGVGTFDSVKPGLAVSGTNLYFVAKEPDATLQLLKVSSAGTGVTEVKDLGPDSGSFGGFGGIDIGSAAFLDGKFYFTIASPPFFFGGTPYVTDGTMAGTAKLVDGVSAAGLTASGHKLFFAGGDAGGLFTLEPWVSDGTGTGTHQIEDINGFISPGQPSDLTVAGGRLVFDACDEAHGCEPWVSDGTGAGTRLLQDITAGTGDSLSGDYTAVGDTVFFTAFEAAHGTELWKTNADGGVTLVKDIKPGTDDSNPDDFVAFKGELYFTASASLAAGRDLWKSDGTEAGTVLLTGLIPGGDPDPTALTVVEDKLFFMADDPDDNSNQLWVTDGSAAGIVEITQDLTGGAVWLTALDGVLYFVANDATHGNELWVSDGTAAGTRLLADLVPGADDADPENLTAFDGRLYFTAFTAGHGRELWVSDGTAAGTKLFAELNPDAGSSDPDWLTAAGGKLYFTAWTPDAGYELWMTDGAATVQVKDIYAGAKSSAPSVLTAIGNRIAFDASDGVNGYEPWISDGTAAGTRMLGDVDAGANSSNPLSYVYFKRRLYFSAGDGTGAELWRADINRRPVASDATIATAFETAVSDKFAATDPDGDALAFAVTKNPAHGKVEVTDAATGAFTYTPADGYSGKDSFTFNADDGLADASATMRITVQSADDGTAPPSGDGGDAPADSDGGGSGGGGALGLLGSLLLLGALSRRRVWR